MDKKLNIGLNIFIVIFVLLIFFLGFFLGRDAKKESYNNEIYQTQIDSLQNKLDSLYNVEKEVDIKIDTITIEIEKTKIKYEKERNTILNNTPSEDYRFFTDYIESNRERLYDNYNN